MPIDDLLSGKKSREDIEPSSTELCSRKLCYSRLDGRGSSIRFCSFQDIAAVTNLMERCTDEKEDAKLF